MEQVIKFIKENKGKIIAILTAILTFVISMSEIDMGAKMGIVCSILIVIIPIIISLIEGNDMNKTITLLVNAITVIQQIVKNQKEVENISEDVVGADKDILDLTKDEIKELITKEI